MKQTARPVLLLCALAFYAPRETIGQDQGLTEPIRVEVAEVPVDVIVLDRHGTPVLDLEKKDFIVLEDGEPQAIRHFSLESHIARQDVANSRPSAESAGPPTSAPFGGSQNRTFLIYIGRGQHRFVKRIPELIEFIRARMEPADRVGFMAFGRSTDLTTDGEQVIRVLQRFQQIAPQIEAQLGMRKNLAAMTWVDQGALALRDFQDEIDRIFNSDGERGREMASRDIPDSGTGDAEVREALVKSEQAMLEVRRGKKDEGIHSDFDDGDLRTLIMEGADRDPSFNSISEQVEERLTRDGMGLGDYLERQSEGKIDFQGLRAAIEYLRYINGEKHVIFLNDQGLSVAGLEGDDGLASIASDARVRIHSIQMGANLLPVKETVYSAKYVGPSPLARSRPLPGTLNNGLALRAVKKLARLTGGESFTQADLTESLQAVERATGATYLIGYVPKNRTPDGRFRRIDVKVDRPGLRALCRRGYYADVMPRVYDATQFRVYARSASAAGAAELLNDVDISLKADRAPRGSGSAGIRTSLAIRPAASVYVLKDGRYTGRMAISYFLFNRDGELIAETWDNVDMALRPETYDRVLREGFPADRNLDLPAGVREAILRVVVYDIANDRLGSAEAKINKVR